MVANFKNQCASFNVNGKRCRMKSLNDNDTCYFHNKKKCMESDSDQYTMDRVDNLESVIENMIEQIAIHTNQLDSVEHIIYVQKFIIMFLFVVYMSILYRLDPEYSKQEINRYIVEPFVSYFWSKTNMVKEYVDISLSYYYHSVNTVVTSSSDMLDNACSIDEIITMYQCTNNDTPDILYKNYSNI